MSDFVQEEIQQLKLKLEKVEKERNELRLNTDRLESRVKITLFLLAHTQVRTKRGLGLKMLIKAFWQ